MFYFFSTLVILFWLFLTGFCVKDVLKASHASPSLKWAWVACVALLPGLGAAIWMSRPSKPDPPKEKKLLPPTEEPTT